MIDREFFLGFIKIHILYHASKAPVFGAELTGELARHGYSLSPGTLYPALHQLEKQAHLKSSRRLVRGRVRKYYETTGSGRAVLKEAIEKIKELVSEVIEEES